MGYSSGCLYYFIGYMSDCTLGTANIRFGVILTAFLIISMGCIIVIITVLQCSANPNNVIFKSLNTPPLHNSNPTFKL